MLRALVEQLADDYDLDVTRVQGWIKTKKGIEQFVTYLTEQGFKVTTYTWPTEEKDPMSWGLEFDDDNPNFVAFRLKYWDEGKNT